MDTYKKLCKPPDWALKKITGGRLSGKTDINPQWRIQAMTEQYGTCGIGWKYTIDKLWTEIGADSEVMAWALVSVFIKDKNEWSSPIHGIGGNFLVEKERAGLHNNDEAYKMAVTDALSVALKFLGVGADVYAGQMDGSKYYKPVQAEESQPKLPNGKPDIFDDSVLKKKAIQVINQSKNLSELDKAEQRVRDYLSTGDLLQTTADELLSLIKEKASKMK